MRKIYRIGMVMVVITFIAGVITVERYAERNREGAISEWQVGNYYEYSNRVFDIWRVPQYIPYEGVYNENSLRCRIYLYNSYEGMDLTIKDVEEYLEDEFLENGEVKTYYDDPKIFAYVEWWFTGNFETSYDLFCNDICSILWVYVCRIDLDEYSGMDDTELVESVPIYKIRDLQETYHVENLAGAETNLSYVSPETLEAAFDIYEWLVENGEIYR